MFAVELFEACKSYDKFVAVDDLSFAVASGLIYGLLGPNGAGKTTTLRMIIGIMAPDSGAIRLFGEPFVRGHLRRIGYLPEERGLYRKMTVCSHLVLLARLQGLSFAEAARRARNWVERLGIESHIDKKVEELSKGMQQKIQFIAALLHDPELIIMDEPFGGLDPMNAALLKDVLLELRRDGKTILLSTHRMEQAEKLCDAICLINRGKAVLDGNLQAIKASYGRNHVQIAYEGDGSFLKQDGLVQSSNDYGNYVEVCLKPGADPQQLLRAAVANARVSKFELVGPSLEEIFVEVVGRSAA